MRCARARDDDSLTEGLVGCAGCRRRASRFSTGIGLAQVSDPRHVACGRATAPASCRRARRRPKLAAALRVRPATARCLVGRGVIEPRDAQGFIDPRLAALRPPTGLAGHAARGRPDRRRRRARRADRRVRRLRRRRRHHRGAADVVPARGRRHASRSRSRGATPAMASRRRRRRTSRRAAASSSSPATAAPATSRRSRRRPRAAST